ncbi:NAD-dependent epimerase/dehydratase family protein [Pseudomonas sp. BR20]|uniref:NAD-dependent epimerase/dehydratase family protein n=1 Tax=Pseudomonas sp. BR20 TaxID=3137452 RepID=UPI003D6E3EBC
MPEVTVGVLGASSLVGRCLLVLLAQENFKLVAFSRQPQRGTDSDAISWQQLPEPGVSKYAEPIPYWICVAPIWALPQHFALLQACGARKVVALSSTSRFSKSHSVDSAERRLASLLGDAEARVEQWAQDHGVHWGILRPTLIYGQGRDKNISEIARFIRRFGFFPLLGGAMGLRQPVHAEDVASACMRALQAPKVRRHAYNLSGAETLPYREMVARVFTAQNRRPRLLTVPLWGFRITLLLLRVLPRYRHWSAAMAQRMNQDLVFEHTDAARDLGFAPRGFLLSQDDLH